MLSSETCEFLVFKWSENLNIVKDIVSLICKYTLLISIFEFYDYLNDKNICKIISKLNGKIDKIQIKLKSSQYQLENQLLFFTSLNTLKKQSPLKIIIYHNYLSSHLPRSCI